MQIPVDFSHRVTVEELDTGKKAVFLIIRGTNEKVRVPAGQAEEIEAIMPTPPPAEELETQGGIPVVRVAEHHHASADGEGEAPAPIRGLAPGKMSGPAKPSDAFGAQEG